MSTIIWKALAPLRERTESLINFGAQRYSEATSRRIRVINTAVLIADAVLIVSVIITSAVLIYKGQPFVTLGNLSLCALEVTW